MSVSSAARPFVLHTRVVTGVGGGPEKTLLNSPRFLAERGFDSACLFMHPPNDEGFEQIVNRAGSAGAEVVSVVDRGPLDWRVVRECVRVCRQRQVTVWHAHDYKSNAIGLLVRRFHPMRLVSTVHGWVRHTKRTPLYYWIDRTSLRRYDHVVCVSQDLLDRCHEMGVPPDRLSLIENAIVLEDYRRTTSRAAARDRFGVPSDRILLGACGRLSEEKGFDLLIAAVGRLVRDGFDVGLLIAGEGHLAAALQDQVDAAGLQDRVQLVGFCSDPRDLYQAIDLFVLSSLREGLPNVVLEAMASGVPVLATRVAGIPAVMTDGEQGRVVEPGCSQQLYDGLRSMLNQRELCTQMAAAAQSRLAENFSFAARMNAIAGVYESLLASGSQRSEEAATPAAATTSAGIDR